MKIIMETIDVELHKRFFKRLAQEMPQVAHSSYMTSLFFVISGLDLLDELEFLDKENMIDWIYEQNVIITSEDQGKGGFRSNPSTKNLSNYWDYGNLASTYSALGILLILGDDLSRIDKVSLVSTLKALQKDTGNFRSHRDGLEADMRFVFCVCAVCSILDH